MFQKGNSGFNQTEIEEQDNSVQPFKLTIQALKGIYAIESPMKKLELIYQILHSNLVSEIDKFWEGVPLNPAKLEIDYENLNGIGIYLVLSGELSNLLVDIIYIENFVSYAIQ